jgi:hypothetical protein
VATRNFLLEQLGELEVERDWGGAVDCDRQWLIQGHAAPKLLYGQDDVKLA